MKILSLLIQILDLLPIPTATATALQQIGARAGSLFQGWNNLYKEADKFARKGTPLRGALDSFAEEMEEMWKLLRTAFGISYPK